jgi:hypothetical protein
MSKEKETKMPHENNGGITHEQLEGWKKEYKEVHVLEVKRTDGTKVTAYLKPPGREVVALAMSKYSQDKILESGETVLNNCFLGGDTSFKTDYKVAMSAAIQASSIVEFYEGSIKKY